MPDDKPQEWRGGYGDVSPGEPPRYTGSAPGYGSHGMGYGPQGGTQSGSFGVYGVPRNVVRDYASSGRHEPYTQFDEPHGRMPFGWTGSFGSGGEYSARQNDVGPAMHPSTNVHGSAPSHFTHHEHSKRGPKFTRNDQRIREDVCDRLTNADRIDASEVMVEVKDGVVTLLGTVPHRAMKHWIEDIAAETSGVKDVENKLNVALVGLAPADKAASK